MLDASAFLVVLAIAIASPMVIQLILRRVRIKRQKLRLATQIVSGMAQLTLIVPSPVVEPATSR